VAQENPSLRERLGSALSQVMEDDDQVVASTVAVSGPWALALWAVLALGLAGFLAVMVAYGARGGRVLGPWPPAWAAIALVLYARQRAFFLVVTGRAVICYRAARFTGAPGPLAFTAPLPAVTAAVGRRSPLGRAVRVSVPGQRPRRLRLSARGRWQHDSDEVIAALAAGRASVTGHLTPAGS
jgi:hypothetical protein